MSKYSGIAEYLKRRDKELTLSFEDVAALVAGGLPDSAYQYSAWWANDPNHVQAKVWLNAGWETRSLNLTSKKVTFVPR
jgi:hypothetical protein